MSTMAQTDTSLDHSAARLAPCIIIKGVCMIVCMWLKSHAGGVGCAFSTMLSTYEGWVEYVLSACMQSS